MPIPADLTHNLLTNPSRYMDVSLTRQSYIWSHGVMVSTQDSESCDPSSNLGET